MPALSFLSSVAVMLSIWLFVTQRPWAAFIIVILLPGVVGSLVSLISSSRRRRYSYADHRRITEAWSPDYIPSVDVFLPTAGEGLEVLQNTYTYVSRLQWHGDLRVLVLDDADRPEVRDAANHFGFDYHVRPDRGHLKKAGNLLAGFHESDGDFILVLDADFVPREDIFYEMLPYMDDSSVGIVQTPQFFDSEAGMSALQRAAGNTQVLFYRWVQPSRDRSNAAICVGTSAVYRRTALEKIGGFAQIGHSEDVHTGVRMMADGYVVRYIPVLVTKGLCPADFDSFVTQQYRWCTGSMSLLLSGEFHKHPFTFMQRLSYWSGFLYYISTGINIFTLVVPPVLMGVFAPGDINPTNYALVVFALGLRLFIVPVITMSRSSMNSISRIQITYSFAHAVALWDQIRRRSDSWIATGDKTRSVTAQRVGTLSRWWCVIAQGALWSVLLWRVPEYGVSNYWPLVLLTVLNLWLVVPIVARRDVGWLSR